MKILNKFVEKFNLTLNWQKAVQNIYWAVLGKVVNTFGALVVAIFVARYLGPEQYGLMNYVISYVLLFTIIATFGLDNIIIRELSKNPDNKGLILGTSFIVRLVLAVFTVVLILITLLLFEADQFTKIMIMAYSSTLLINCFTLIRNYFTAIVYNEYVVKSEISRTFIGVLIKVFLLYIHASLAWFIIATAFDAFLVAGGYILSYKKKVGIFSTWSFDRSFCKYLIIESFPLMLSGTAVIVYQRIDQVMIKNMIDNTAVGYFSVAARITEIILFLPATITQTVTPMLNRMLQKNPDRYEVKKQQFVNYVVWISIITCLLVTVFSYPLIRFSFGNKYIAAVAVLQIMAWKGVGMALSSSSGQLIILEGIQKYAFIRNVFGVIICITMNWILIPKYGIIGSAWASIITVSFSGCLANIFIPPYHKILKIQLQAIFTGWKDLATFYNMLNK